MAEVEMQVELVQTGGITHFHFHQKSRRNPTSPGRLPLFPVPAKALGFQCPGAVPTAVLLRQAGSANSGAQRI